jgi:hypothetical protein
MRIHCMDRNDACAASIAVRTKSMPIALELFAAGRRRNRAALG